MDLIKNIFKDIRVKTIIYSLMLFSGTLLLMSGYISVTKDSYIEKGFSYLYLCLIYIVIYLVLFITNINKPNVIYTSVCFVLSLLFLILVLIKYNSNGEFIFRYIFCTLTTISFVCLFKTIIKFLK